MTAGNLHRDAIPSRDEYADRFGIKLQGRGRNVMGPCGIHGGSDSASFHADGPWHCFSCGASGGDMLDYHRQVHSLTLSEAARELGCWVEDGKPLQAPGKARQRPVAPVAEREPPEPAPAYVEALWRQSEPLQLSAAAEYLRSRHCVLPPADGDLRSHTALKHPSGYVGPALLGRITHAVTNEPMGLHRTWINADGTKAAEPGKMTLGPKRGGVIRLWADDWVTSGLAIGEGIETCLSLAHVFQPVWCCVDAGNLAAFPVLPGICSLTIAVDHDPAGLKAANDCAARWHAAGRHVRLVMPPRSGADLNDLAREAA